MFRTTGYVVSAALVVWSAQPAPASASDASRQAAAAQPAQATTAEEVVATNLAARGGLEKLKSLQSARITGRIVAEGRELPVTVWSKRPNLMRRQVLAGDQRILSGFDGTTAWTVHPAFGLTPRTQTGAQAEGARNDAEFDNVFVDYREKGRTIELVGTETINGRPAHHLRLTRKTGQVQHHYIDAENGQELRFVATVEQGGRKAEFVTEYSDYRQVDGVTVPFTMRQSVNGTPNSEVIFEKIEFNVPIDDTLFKAPPARQ